MSRKISRMSRISSQLSRVMARETAFKALFQLEFNFAAEGEDNTAYEDLAIETMIEDADFLTQGDDPRKLTEEDLLYVKETVKGTRAHLAEIDEIISANLKQSWQLSRLMAADRNILRLAVYEMQFAEPPLSKSIAINEAVELAKIYGTDDSSRFVNGLLEAISK